MADDDPIEPGELLFRRIPASQPWYDPLTGLIDEQAFRPISHDVDGLSVTRSRHTTPREVAATGRLGKRYYVAVLSARDVIENGLRVQPTPDRAHGLIDHCSIPALTYSVRNETAAINYARGLSRHTLRVEGPFEGKTPPQSK